MKMLQRVILIALIAGCLMLSSSMFAPGINRIRMDLGALAPAGAADLTPDTVLLSHMLGGFRGLLVNAVWLRAGKLQQAEKYWELYQLYDWIGKLEPRLESIWDFNAWNMSYNLVAELSDSEARWQWIDRALTYLRDQGLKYNPRSGKIMERISWIYFHKIGRDLDLHHHYYKHRWALEMNAVVGDRKFQNAGRMAAAPVKLADLLKDPDVVAALSRFQLDPPEETVLALEKAEGLHQIPKVIVEELRKEKNTEARLKIRHYISANVLRTRFKMDRLDLVEDMEKDFGQFDWRMPEPHGLYWALLGRQMDKHRPKRQIEYDRLILYCLQESMRRGILTYVGPNPMTPIFTDYDLTKIEPIDNLYEMMRVKHRPKEEDRGSDSVRDGHEQFLREAAFQLYFAGYETEAQEYHLKRYKLYDKPHPYMGLKPYVEGQVEKMVNEYGTRAKVEGELVKPAIVRSCVALCRNRPEKAARWEKLARNAWDAFRNYAIAQNQDKKPTTEGPKDGRGRTSDVGLPTFKELQREMVRGIMLGYNTHFPPRLIPALRLKLGVTEEQLKTRPLTEEEVAPRRAPGSSPGAK